ncbi:MAG: toll/interleukin-1 receptor domain-containing protein [Sulfuritalea sp.]|nr:toll/interleukin-1 receptor domain-containing protein [Sulfuritalea sp.]
MADVFISYSSKDERLARFVHDHLGAENVSVFLASTSIELGQRWSPEILRNLNIAKWVIFLASRHACASPYVQQELGAAIAANKTLIPVIWDITPSELPGWVSQYQALNIANKSITEVQSEVSGIAKRIRAKKADGLALFGLIIAGLVIANKK